MRVSESKKFIKNSNGGKTLRSPGCHPERKYHCKDMCKQCYDADCQRRRMSNPEWVKRKRNSERKYRINNRERINASQRSAYLEKICRDRGIEVEEFHQMMQEQEGNCYICKLPMGDKICLDHDHATGLARKLLCHNCNVGLGSFKDSVKNLQEAAKYLIDNSRKRY